jgi:hypothetical protein
LLNDRPPLLLRANVQAACGGAFPLTVIVNHFRSLLGVDDPTDGPRVRAKRRAQGEFLANLIEQRQTANPDERLLAVGDFNSFQFSDGYVDAIGAAKGTPIPANQVVLASNDLVNNDLANLVEEATPEQRYSYVFNGNAQAIDHALATQNLRNFFSRLHYGRVNADFPETFRSDATRPERISDHDPLMAYFKIAGVSPRQFAANDFGEIRALEVSAPAGCAWTAVSNDSWLSVLSGVSGTGPGSVTIRAEKSFLTETRVGTLTIAGRAVTVIQAASREYCPNRIATDLLKDVPATGGGGTINARGCAWTAVSNNRWITITSGATGQGAGTVTFTVEPNTNATRRGTITVAGKTFTVKQNPR